MRKAKPRSTSGPSRVTKNIMRTTRNYKMILINTISWTMYRIISFVTLKKIIFFVFAMVLLFVRGAPAVGRRLCARPLGRPVCRCQPHRVDGSISRFSRAETPYHCSFTVVVRRCSSLHDFWVNLCSFYFLYILMMAYTRRNQWCHETKVLGLRITYTVSEGKKQVLEPIDRAFRCSLKAVMLLL